MAIGQAPNLEEFVGVQGHIERFRLATIHRRVCFFDPCNAGGFAGHIALDIGRNNIMPVEEETDGTIIPFSLYSQ